MAFDTDADYYKLLRYIDRLRSQGLQDSDPEMMQARIKLHDFLEQRKKKRNKNALVPKVKAVKTVTIKSNITTLANIEPVKLRKYAMLGVAVGIAGVLWQFFKKKN